MDQKIVAQQNLNTLVAARTALPLAGSITAVIVARRMYGLKFWGSLGVWIAAGILVSLIVAAATQSKWNENIANGAISPLDTSSN